MTPLVRLAGASRRHAPAVVLGGIVLALVSALAAYLLLGDNADASRGISDRLPWRQSAIALDSAFPQLRNQLVAEVDGNSPEIADDTAAALAGALAADTAHFAAIRRPDASLYLQRQRLMFIDTPALQAMMAHTIEAQPFLGQLAADPSARGLFASLALLGIGMDQGRNNPATYRPALDNFHRSLQAVLDGVTGGSSGSAPTPMSWTQLFGPGLEDLQGKTRRVLIEPRPDQAAPRSGTMAALSAAIAQLEFVRSGQAHVHVEGPAAAADAPGSQNMGTGLLASVGLITLVLFLALRSWRLVLPVLGTLGLGLALTSLLAALAVGTLGPIPAGFPILFIGIASGFAIRFCILYRRSPDDPRVAGRAGTPIAVAATAAAAAFLAFVPTDLTGLATLGLICGPGMAIAFACTMIFLPAAMTICGAGTQHTGPDFAWTDFAWAIAAGHRIIRRRSAVIGGFAGILVLSLAALPRLQIDPGMDSASGEPGSAYSATILAPNLQEADRLAAALAQAEPSGTVLTLDSLVPPDQPAKLAVIASAAAVLAPTLAKREPAAPVTGEQIRMAGQTALVQIEPALEKLPPDHPLAAIAGDLRHLIACTGPELLSAGNALIHFLPGDIDNLRTALTATPATRADLPADIAQDWLLPDGRARVQVLAPIGTAPGDLPRFVETVRGVAPDATGPAVETVETAKAIAGAFRTALIVSLLAVVAILFAALRRPLDVVLTLVPALLAAATIAPVCLLTGIQLNDANILAAPLLLALGASFNCGFVTDWRAGLPEGLGGGAAQAAVFSALAAGAAFGCLAVFGQPPLSGLGVLLLLGSACTLATSLLLMPALLACLWPAGPATRR